LTEIDGVPMSGNLDEIEFLKKLWSIDQMNSPGFSLKETTHRHSLMISPAILPSGTTAMAPPREIASLGIPNTTQVDSSSAIV
jgi:hypothetical protein